MKEKPIVSQTQGVCVYKENSVWFSSFLHIILQNINILPVTTEVCTCI